MSRVAASVRRPLAASLHWLPAAFGVLALAALVAAYPLGSTVLAAMLAGYALLLTRVPSAAWVVLPACLPVLDLAPLTGRFYFDEFDILLLATWTMAMCRRPSLTTPSRYTRTGATLFGLFALSALLAACQTAWTPHWPDLNAYNNYYSGFNGLRAGKGLLWCLALLPVLRRELARDAVQVQRLFGLGMTLGVAAAAAIVLWERLAFTGLFNLAGSYRVVGGFAAMHTGGAQIEAYLALGLPFVAWSALTPRRGGLGGWAAAVFLAGCYALMVTYARGGYLALLVGMLILAAVARSARAAAFGPVPAALLLATLVAVALPLSQGATMRGRFASTGSDLQSRAMHWRAALAMMDGRPLTTLFGIGGGRFPALSYAAAGAAERPSAYRFENDAGNIFLQLTAGDPLYFEQVVALRPHTRYRLSFSARGRSAQSAVGLPVCERWLLYSANCALAQVKIGDTQGRWRSYTREFDSGALGQHRWYAWRPVKLALYNAGDGTLDLDNVSLQADGAELIDNGRFDQVMDHWFFSTARFDSWHIENTWLQLYIEQGAVGLALFVALLGYAARCAYARRAEAGFALAPLVAAGGAFLALGVVDSLLDFPRLALLFYCMLSLLLLRAPPRRRPD